MRKREIYDLISALTVLSMVLALPSVQGVGAQLPAGIRREDTLIIDCLHGRTPDPTQCNYWVPGTEVGRGTQQFLLDTLWYTSHGDASLICALASSPPKYNDAYTQLTIKLRKGIYWSDGVEFTADDVVYTIQAIKNNTGFANYPLTNKWVKSISAPDKYTVVIDLTSPNPYFYTNFLCEVYSCPYYIMPKHVFEKQADPAKYNFYPPVSLGPYVLDSYDPTGYWNLYKLRDDWRRTSVEVWAIAHGKLPGPKYVLSCAYDTDDAKILAQSKHQLDWIFDVTTEGWKSLQSMSHMSGSWFKNYPWEFCFDATARGIYFECDKYPYNMTDVRWVLALATNMTEVMITAFDGCQILCPVPTGQGCSTLMKWQLGLKSELANFTLTLPDGSTIKPLKYCLNLFSWW